MEFNIIITFVVCIIVIFIVGKMFILPIKSILKLILNSILGGLLIWLINFAGTNFGFHIGLNLFTCIFIGILGLPGAIFLVILKLVLQI